ncbi:MAG: hypothetical protein ACI9TH_003885 [Kiritimatiellia bacterium]|jgi:hypothetical protein
MKSMHKTFITIALITCATALRAKESTLAQVQPFFDRHCFDCHDDETQKGDLDLTQLKFNPADPATFATWERIYDRVRSGEMPPEKKPRPDKDHQASFLTTINVPLLAADRKDRIEKGRVHVRRLTRMEYEYTVHDLLGIDLPLHKLLPEDPATHGFETVASGQQLSHHHLARYLEAADQALNHAFDRAINGDETYNHIFSPKELGQASGGSGNYRGPETRDDITIAWPIKVQFYGRMTRTRVPESGWYRITLKDLHAINPKNGVVWGSLQSGDGYSNSPIMYPIAPVEAGVEPRDQVFEAWIQKDHLLRLLPNDATLKQAPTGAGGGNVSYKGRDLKKQGFAGLAFKGIVVERIYPNATRQAVRQNLFGGLAKEDTPKLSSKADRGPLLEKVLGTFARRAFRRPVTREQLAPYVKLASNALDASRAKPVDALRVAYRAMLCSPRFLTFVETPGQLDAYAVASRLSYMLWNSMPDEALMRAASKDAFKDGKTRQKEVTRMLADPKSQRFITSFTDQWLDFRDINITTPDQRMFRMWDPILQDSMLAETRAFVNELLKRNLPIQHLIQSDFAMLNERLARHYDLKEVDVKPGEGLQRVHLEDDPRGGLITQGAVLKVTANGTTTSPVIRGVWINERILGAHIPPPPPNAGSIEPDIRGAISIRDQLDKHRRSESCAACHRTIDPIGFALEQFDPVGRWRTKYASNNKAAVVDPSGITPEGETFKDIREWKALYVKRPEQLTRGFAEQLLTYSTGAAMRFSDRESIEKVVRQAEQQGYGIKSIMLAVIASESFLNK